jgi:hypothetical protein
MSTVDLHELRCAVATLVCAVGCGGQLDPRGMRRVDTAVAVLSTVRATHTSGRGVGEAIDRLLSTERDPGGVRTLAAIDELAALMNVGDDTAPALAARLRQAPSEQGQLFKP